MIFKFNTESSYKLELLYELSKREFMDRYIGQSLGVLWSIIQPLCQLIVYLIVFGVFFQSKISLEAENSVSNGLYILAGLSGWLAFQDVMSRSTQTIISSKSIVKQVIFPIEILPLKVVLVSVFQNLLLVVLLIIYNVLTRHSLSIVYFALPYLIMFQTICLFGISYFFSAISVYVRDLKDIVQLYSIVGVYFLPIIYGSMQLPTILKTLITYNPITYFIYCYQDVIYFSAFKHHYAWASIPIISVVVFFLGYTTFTKLKSNFANVL